jgi:Rps23 Pro-64 3,4-dihydroxylase Tpa1-like proline 4-hydroxylase
MEDVSPLSLNDCQDTCSLNAQFSQHGRVQKHNLIEKSHARELHAALTRLEWRLVLNEGEKHFDIHPLQIKQLGRKKMMAIKNAAKQRAQHSFQYLFENYPIHDAIKAGRSLDTPIERVYKTFNTEQFLQKICYITGEDVSFCDMQATRFRTGHFLTKHDDQVEGKNRRLAFVFSLSEKWRPNWGGQLEFLSPDDDVVEAFCPRFNTLSIFKVPSDHQVSAVKPDAQTSRLSLTGWFRTGGK